MLNIKVGDKAPQFCLENTDEKKVCLKDFLGKWIVLYFYPKDGTSGCTLEAVDFTKHLEDFTNMDAVVIGVSPDSVKSHQKFREKNELTVQLLSNEDKSVLEKYGVWQEKSMYGKQYFGVVRSTLLIDPKGEVAEVWEKVSVKDHIQSVKKRLKELHS